MRACRLAGLSPSAIYGIIAQAVSGYWTSSLNKRCKEGVEW